MTLVGLAIVDLRIERPCPSDSHGPKSDKLGQERGSYLYACPRPFRFHVHSVGSWWFVGIMGSPISQQASNDTADGVDFLLVSLEQVEN